MSFLSGVMLGLSLIIAIGAQNIWILSQCMAGANRFVLAAVCILCDATLIIVGVFAANELKLWLPGLLPWLTWGGIAMLLYLAFGSARSAIKGTSGLKVTQVIKVSWWKTALAAFAISLLNPHVYLDTVFLLGAISTKFEATRLAFSMGAISASFIFFFTLGYSAKLLKPVFEKPISWKVLELIIGIIMLSIAISLLRY